jgi:GT2 family glycosyltransferase
MPADPVGIRASALVCTKDRPSLLLPCLESLGASLGPEDELIVVDGGSTGPAPRPDRVEQFLYQRADRSGKSHQLNIGIATARGDVILITDDDVRVAPDWVDAMIEPFGDPSVGLACGRVTGLSMAPGFDRPHPVDTGEAPFETWTFAHGAAMAVRRVAALQVGGFDERLGPGAGAVGEDHDFLLRVREAGWKVVVTSAPPAAHEGWRSASEDRSNALAYERGGGAVVGAAIRRSGPGRWRLLRARLGYQRRLVTADRRFGLRGFAAFAGGLLYGLGLARHAFLEGFEPTASP